MKKCFFCTLEVHSQCSGGIWPIQNTTIGSFTVSWRYNITMKTIQFIIQGKFMYFISEFSIEY